MGGIGAVSAGSAPRARRRADSAGLTSTESISTLLLRAAAQPVEARRGRAGAEATAKAFPAEDRQALVLLSLPVVALLLAFGVMQAAKHARYSGGREMAAGPLPAVVRPVERPAIAQSRIVPPSETKTAAVAPNVVIARSSLDTVTASGARVPEVGAQVPDAAKVSPIVPPGLSTTGKISIAKPAGTAAQVGTARVTSLAPSVAVPEALHAATGRIGEAATQMPVAALDDARVPPVVTGHGAPAAEVAGVSGPRSIATDGSRPAIVRPAMASKDIPALSKRSDGAKLAMLAPSPPADGSSELPISAPPVVSSRDEPGERPQLCLAKPATGRTMPVLFQSLTPAAFGSALATSARGQTADLVIYNDTYRHMAYPMGDVPALYGVCTDVVIRAYRGMGIDLQQRVHESGLGSGDTSIEHRRTETLRRFFARYGEQLPPSTFAEDFRPGDIVTYDRPQNRHSRSHIAVVSDVLGASGRYMIVHNRGWGPQLEDALFVDEITGHYRYTGGGEPVVAAAVTTAKVKGIPANVASANTWEGAVSCGGVARGRQRALCVHQAQAGGRRMQREGLPASGLGR